MRKTLYQKPQVVNHQAITFETSQSWNRGRGPVSEDSGASDGTHYRLNPYPNKKVKTK